MIDKNLRQYYSRGQLVKPGPGRPGYNGGDPIGGYGPGGSWNGGPPGGGDPGMTYTAPPKDPRPGGGDPGMTYTKPPVRTGGASPFAYTRRPNINPRNMRQISRLRKEKKTPGYFDFAASLVNPWETEEWAGDEGSNITATTRGLLKGLKDYMFGKGITSLQNLPADAKVWMAHGPKPDDYAKIAEKGFSGVRPASKITNLVSPRSWEQMLQGKNPLTSTGVYTAVGKTEKEALEAAAKFGKGPLTRGLGKGVDASKVFTAQVPRSTFPIHTGVLRTPQMEVPASFANKYFGIGDKGLKVGAAPAKGMIKSTIGRMIPGVGAALGAASATKHFQEKNYGQALMAGLSMAPGPLGWAGLAGELGLGALANMGPVNTALPQNTLVMNKGGRASYFDGGLANLWLR